MQALLMSENRVGHCGERQGCEETSWLNEWRKLAWRKFFDLIADGLRAEGLISESKHVLSKNDVYHQGHDMTAHQNDIIH